MAKGVFGMNDHINTSNANGPEPLPNRSTTQQKPRVPVGLGTILGLLLFAVGIGMCFTDLSDEPNALTVRLIGVLVTMVGATLAGGGVYVFLAERRGRIATPSLTPEKMKTAKWAYVFAAITFAGVFIGSALGQEFAGYGGRFFPGYMVGAIAGPIGLIAAGTCVGVSRNMALSVPRRIYACILIAGFSCPTALGVTLTVFQLIKGG
jgi:uncharacterized membrane protein YczE